MTHRQDNEDCPWNLSQPVDPEDMYDVGDCTCKQTTAANGARELLKWRIGLCGANPDNDTDREMVKSCRDMLRMATELEQVKAERDHLREYFGVTVGITTVIKYEKLRAYHELVRALEKADKGSGILRVMVDDDNVRDALAKLQELDK